MSIADTTRTPEQMGRDAIGRTEAQVIGTSPIERTSALEREEERPTSEDVPWRRRSSGSCS